MGGAFIYKEKQFYNFKSKSRPDDRINSRPLHGGIVRKYIEKFMKDAHLEELSQTRRDPEPNAAVAAE